MPSRPWGLHLSLRGLCRQSRSYQRSLSAVRRGRKAAFERCLDARTYAIGIGLIPRRLWDGLGESGDAATDTDCGSQVSTEPDLIIVSVGSFADSSFPPPTESGYVGYPTQSSVTLPSCGGDSVRPLYEAGRYAEEADRGREVIEPAPSAHSRMCANVPHGLVSSTRRPSKMRGHVARAVSRRSRRSPAGCCQRTDVDRRGTGTTPRRRSAR